MNLFSQNAEIIKENGKYGLFDKNHGVVLAPDCDSIMTNLGSWRWNGMFFILQKDNKFAYAYFRNLDSLGELGYSTPHWVISEYLYDELKVFPYTITIRYKIGDKYGLLYFNAHLDCAYGIWTICIVDGLGELYQTEAIYDKPFTFNKHDKLLHVYSDEAGGYQLLDYVEFADGHMKWKNYTHDQVFDSIVIYPDSETFAERNYRTVKKNGKWGLIKIDKDSNSIEYIIPCINESNEDIWNRKFEVFYTKKAVNDTLHIVDTDKNLQLKLNIPTDGGLGVFIDILEFYAKPESYKTLYKRRYLMLGFNYDVGYKFFYNKIIIIDHNGNIKSTYNEPNAEYFLHRNPWGFLICQKTTDGKQWIHDFFNLETGEQVFTIKTKEDLIIGSCYLSEIPKIPLYTIVSDKQDKMVGYYDFFTRKYYKKPPPEGERCYGF